MKNKPTEKKRHDVVAWVNKGEWDQVYGHLYSKDSALQKWALHRISAWKARFANRTPVAVECTADLVRCQVLEGKLGADDLRLMYATALVRFVNGMTQRLQKKVARNLRRLASQIKIPEWLVDFRHEVTHRSLPTLPWCRRGCKVALEWLQQEYWSRQLGSLLNENWDSQSEGEDEEDFQRQEDRLIARQKEVESYKKARELLISYEVEQFQIFDGFPEEDKQKSVWPSLTEDLRWILTQIEHFSALESRETLIDVLMEDGFLVPTIEQLESLDVDPSDGSPTSPCLPRVVLRFWLPLLKMLNSKETIQLLLEKLFVELQQLSGDANKHRSFYLSAWISEVILCNIKKSKYHKSQKKGILDRIFINRIQLNWQQLLSACLDAPCTASPHLLGKILEDMEHPLPLDTQQKLLRLCSIYTQRADSGRDTSPERTGQPIYTLESLHERLLLSRRGHAMRTGTASDLLRTLPERTEDFPENADVLAERARELRGSPWQVCTDKVQWKKYPLGRMPGQSEDPSCLMIEKYSTMTVFDQQVEIEHTTHNVHTRVSHRATADGHLWTHSEANKLKAGLQLF